MLECLRQTGRTILVSTNLTDEAVCSVHSDIKVIVRANVGYDFYSYKVGLESIEELDLYDHVFIMNSSFVCFDPDKLISRFVACLDESVDVLGLTFSRERIPHLQSYFIAFSRRTIMSAPLRKWWNELKPASDREVVISRYELGLSSFLFAQGFNLAGAYEPSPMVKCQALCHAIRLGLYRPRLLPFSMMMLNLRHADKLNPTHFLWEDLLSQFGVLKRELYERNPYHCDLQSLYYVHGERLASLLK